MKRLIAILIFVMVPFLVNAQRVLPMMDVDSKTCDEAIKLLQVMERASLIENMEGMRLKTDMITTSGGEIALRREGNSIKIIHTEFTSLIEKHLTNPRYRLVDVESIRTELVIQNAKLYEYIYERIYRKSKMKNMIIEIDPRTGISFIRVNYHHL